eukprot:UN04833
MINIKTNLKKINIEEEYKSMFLSFISPNDKESDTEDESDINQSSLADELGELPVLDVWNPNANNINSSLQNRFNKTKSH